MNVHAALVEPLLRLAGALEGARCERRDGYTFLAYPTFPVRDLNGMWVDSDAALAHIGDARAEAAELGTPFSIMVREGRSTAVEAAARELGFEPAVRIPGMAVTPDELRGAALPDVEVLRIETADGLKTGPDLHPLQTAFMENFAAQCGYCTPGMLMAAKALLDHNPSPSRAEVVEAISGNICRCTGYEPIINAILAAAARDRRASRA